MNINTLNITHQNTNKLLNAVLTENFVPHITLPTRITHNTNTLIDHILVKTDSCNIEETSCSGNFICDLSDHLPNVLLYGDLNNRTSKCKW